jgi:hypothetical protein
MTWQGELPQKYPDCGLLCVDYIRTVLKEETAGRVTGIVFESIRGWAGRLAEMSNARKRCSRSGDVMESTSAAGASGWSPHTIVDGYADSPEHRQAQNGNPEPQHQPVWRRVTC